jgi:hypothetical protein
MKGLHRSFQRVEDELIARLDRKRQLERALARMSRTDKRKLSLARKFLQSDAAHCVRIGARALNALGIPV